ncbi:Polynucleotidyl transferase- ribonuclease H-like superfamily protein, partial [Striga hermonthica]
AKDTKWASCVAAKDTGRGVSRRVRALRAKYNVNGDFIRYAVLGERNNTNWSFSWKCLVKAGRWLAEGLRRRVGDGSTISFWYDKWLDEPLVDKILPVPGYVDDSVLVSQYITNGKWDADRILLELPMEVASLVYGYPLARLGNLEDTWVWSGSSNGIYTSRSAYMALMDQDIDEPEVPWGKLWKLAAPARWVFFLWLVFRERILTNSLRFRRGMGDSELCPLCRCEVETTLHVLRDCPHATSLWSLLVVSQQWSLFMNSSLREWLSINLFGGLNLGPDSSSWHATFIAAIWRLWTRRCKFLFEPENTTLDAAMLVESIKRTTTEMGLAYTTLPKIVNHALIIAWSPPTPGFVKLNTDGASFGNPGSAGAGGLIRDSVGNWLVGFRLHLGVCTNMVAEMEAGLNQIGLLLAWDEGYRKVICELDAQVVIDLFLNAEVRYN